MKTPREILFARHQAVVPKLDAIRREVVGKLNHQDTKAQSWSTILVSWCLGGSNKLWLELVLPCRRVWTGLAAAWIVIFIVNISQRDGSSAGNAKSPASPEIMMTFGEQQKLLNELFADRSFPAEATQPKIYSPKPRTEILELLTA